MTPGLALCCMCRHISCIMLIMRMLATNSSSNARNAAPTLLFIGKDWDVNLRRTCRESARGCSVVRCMCEHKLTRST